MEVGGWGPCGWEEDEEGGREGAADEVTAEGREGAPLEAGGCVCVCAQNQQCGGIDMNKTHTVGDQRKQEHIIKTDYRQASTVEWTLGAKTTAEISQNTHHTSTKPRSLTPTES